MARPRGVVVVAGTAVRQDVDAEAAALVRCIIAIGLDWAFGDLLSLQQSTTNEEDCAYFFCLRITRLG